MKVSIICCTYNHEKYIEEAIKSFLMQKTNFKFEVLIHDDASTDKTAEIVRKYEKDYPDIIKPIYQTENQYSKGKIIVSEFLIPRAEGKYVALCEGDDYWNHPDKLQKQYDALEAHSEIDMCAHNSIVIHAITGELVNRHWITKNGVRVASIEETILGEGGFVATNSLFFRKSVYENELPFRKIMAYDYTLQIAGALKGGILCLPDFMSAYRFAVPNSFTDRKRKENKQEVSFYLKKRAVLEQLDKDTGNKYHDVITGRLMLNEILVTNKAVENIRILVKYKNGFHVLSTKDKIKILVKCFCPILLRLKHKLFISKRNKIIKELR
ncbi:MAG: glycosyltransferase [Agathobacter sp.]|nr:glycosyltransferase [Agathobacter sp.]